MDPPNWAPRRRDSFGCSDSRRISEAVTQNSPFTVARACCQNTPPLSGRINGRQRDGQSITIKADERRKFLPSFQRRYGYRALPRAGRIQTPTWQKTGSPATSVIGQRSPTGSAGRLGVIETESQKQGGGGEEAAAKATKATKTSLCFNDLVFILILFFSHCR